MKLSIDRSIYSIAILLLFVTAPVYAQVVTLDTVLHRIDKQNPMLQEYDAKVKALNAYTEGARSWMAPMVGAGTFMTPYPGKKVMEERDRGYVMFSFEQEIPNPAKLSANKNYLQSKAGVEQQARAFQYNALRAEAKTLYYQWLVAAQKVNVLHENERIADLMLKLAKIRYPYNQGSLGNIYKVEGRLSEVQNMLLMTQATIEEKSYRLKTLMNIPATDSIMIDTATVVDFQSNQSIYDTAALRANRSDIKQIDQTIEVMRLNQQLQQYQAKPDFKLRFEHMEPIGSMMPSQFTAMAMVSIPIAPWSSRMYRAEVKGMRYDIEAMKKNREAILNEARGMLAGMATQLTRMKQQLNNYETRIIPALRKNYETVMLAYEENREQLPIVIDGWEAMNMAQMEYLEKMEEYYIMIVRYEKELEK
ncbi:TolC family protein [Ohtaekwangia kribbensis]|jgi:cobalt-zinc-cadmium efflux system outer membrane protein|uniref:TolC family protein n=1 Tax=Ohtaekwangia kribbensis TaxID=688913 RepID=A0ABW3K1Q1_9BACT